MIASCESVGEIRAHRHEPKLNAIYRRKRPESARLCIESASTAPEIKIFSRDAKIEQSLKTIERRTRLTGERIHRVIIRVTHQN